MLEEKRSFQIEDYAIFGAVLLVSIAIGLYHSFFKRGQNTTKEYFTGSGNVSVLPVIFSVLATWESSTMVLGLSSEIYNYGFQLILGILFSMLGLLCGLHAVVSLLYPLKLTTPFEFLEMRFKSKTVATLALFFSVYDGVLKNGMNVYSPSVALDAVAKFPFWWSMISLALVATIYTSIGGFKAVIWADVIQFVVMASGILAIVIKGTMKAGGVTEVFHISDRGGRLEVDFSPDPTIRQTFWSLSLGPFFIAVLERYFRPSTMQRIASTRNIKSAKRTIFIVTPIHMTMIGLSMYMGLAAYAYYDVVQCDPIKSKKIKRSDQIIPYMVLDVFRWAPGMPGLFLAALYSASLSTVSSELNAQAAIAWTHVGRPCLQKVFNLNAVFISKLFVILFGVAAFGAACFISLIGGTIFQMMRTLGSSAQAPINGIFFLACFFPRVKAKGAIVGAVVSYIFITWLALGQSFTKGLKVTSRLPPASTEMCPVGGFYGNGTDTILGDVYNDLYNITTIMTTAIPESTFQVQGIKQIYNLSFRLLEPLGIIVAIIIGLITTFFTGKNEPGDVDPRYLLSVVDVYLIWLPEAIKRRLRAIGPQYMREEYKSKFPDPALTWEKTFNQEENVDMKNHTIANSQNIDADENIDNMSNNDGSKIPQNNLSQTISV